MPTLLLLGPLCVASAYQTGAGVALPVAAVRSSPPAMVAAKEVFGQLYEASPPVQKSLQTLPPPVAKTAMAGVVLVTGAAGFALTPSRRLAVNGVGGIITASLGNIAAKRIADERQKASKPAVAALLAQGLKSATSESLAAIGAEFDVPKKEFEAQLADLYLAFVSACLTSHEVQTSELSEMLRLQSVMSLSAAQAGTQIYTAGRQLFSRHRAYLEDDEPNDSKRLLQKFVFLAERVLSSDDSPEGYRYESIRLQKLFSLTELDWRKMAEDAAVPFYEKALRSSVLDGKPATSEQLAQVRGSLGITQGCAAGMHESIFAQAASNMLQGGALSAADQEQLKSTEALLGMSAETTRAKLLALTSPLYTSSVDEIVASITASDSYDDAALTSRMTARQSELTLDAEDARTLATGAMRTAASSSLESALALMRAQDVTSAVAATQDLLSICAKLSAFASGAGVLDSAASGDSLFAGLQTTKPSKRSEILSLYRVLLLDYLSDLKLSDEQSAALESLRTILGVGDAESSSVYAAAAGPLLRKAVGSAIDGGATEAGKAELQGTIATLALPADVTASIAIDIYSGKLTGYVSGGANDEASILSEEQSAELATLRAFLDIDLAQVYDLHERTCAPAYQKSVQEVMGTTGIIPDEYWEGLEALRTRLCISETAAQELFAVEVKGKMKAFAEKAVEALEAKAKAQQEQQEAGGGQMGIEAENALSTEVLNLVDFAVASKALVTQEVDGKEVEVIGANLRSEFDERTLREIYKQFLVEAFSGGSAAQNQRTFDNLNRLTLVLGLKSNEVSVIHNEIGSLIYRQYISKAIQKGPLGAEENQFLASIKDALDMDQERCNELIREVQLNFVSIQVEQMFEKAQVLPEDVRKMRDAADLYDIDLVDDLQVNFAKLERMFITELEDLIESGTLTPEDTSSLAEICEPLHISEEKANQLLEKMVQKRASSGLLQAAVDMRQGSNSAATTELSRMLRYASLLEEIAADAPSVSSQERSDLYMLYQAATMSSGESPADSEAKLELLKALMKLS